MLPVEFEIEVIPEHQHGLSMKARIIGQYAPSLFPGPPEYDHEEIEVWHSEKVGWVDADLKTRIGQIVWDYVNDSRSTDEWLELYRLAAEKQWTDYPGIKVIR